MPPDPLDQIRAYKFPYVSSEILSIDAPEISNSFFKTPSQSIDSTSPSNKNYSSEVNKDNSNAKSPKSIIPDQSQETKNEESIPINLDFLEGIPIVQEEILFHVPPEIDLLEQLFKFVNTDNEINPLLSGYFSNVIQALMNRNRNALLTYVFKNNLDQSLIYHSYDRSISDLLIQILKGESKFENINMNGKIEFYDKKVKIINVLLDNLMYLDVNTIIRANSYIISSIISSRLYRDYFNNHSVIDSIYQIILFRHHPIAQLEGLNIFISLLKIYFGPVINNSIPFDFNSSNQKDDSTVTLYAFTSETPKFLVDIFKIIERREESLNQSSLKNAFSSPNYCNPQKLKIIEFLYYLMNLLSNESISILYCKSQLSSILLNYFIEYSSFSIIHNFIYKIFEKALENCISSIVSAFSVDCDLANFIIKNSSKIQHQFQNSSKKIYHYSSYIYLFYLANKLNSSNNQIIKDYLANLKEWQQFTLNSLKLFNNLIERKIGKKEEVIPLSPIDEQNTNEQNNFQFGSLDDFLGKIPVREDDLDVNESDEIITDKKKKNIFNQRINEKMINFDDIADLRKEIFHTDERIYKYDSEIKMDDQDEIEDEYYKNVKSKSMIQIDAIKETNLDPVEIEPSKIDNEVNEINYWSQIPEIDKIEELRQYFSQ